MLKRKKLLIFIIIFVAMFGLGIYLAYYNLNQMEQYKLSEEMIEYREEQYLKINTPTEELTLSENNPSLPAISPDRTALIYIAPFEWEQPGSIYVYNLQNKEHKKVLGPANLAEDMSPKGVWWYDNNHLLVIVGYAYGTVSVGGDLYLLDLGTADLEQVIELADTEEIISLEIKEDSILLQVARFDDQYIDYEIIERSLAQDKVEELL
ncbi:MAG: DUF4652 domain-containing protein [Bacillota bacterium]